MKTVGLVVLAGLLAAVSLSAAMAYTAPPHYLPLEEVPIERLLKNLEEQRKMWAREGHSKADTWHWSATARVHLLAYLRQTSTLPATTWRNNRQDVGEGPFDHCRPIVSQPQVPKTPKPVWKAKCNQVSWDSAPRAERELPEGALVVRHRIDAHLQSARIAYETVRALSPDFIRPRLALAFVYDRLGERTKAVRELRVVIDIADKLITKAQGDSRKENEGSYGGRGDGYWDHQIVASEAIEHLSLVSKERRDRKAISKLKPKLRAIPIVTWITPILVPLSSKSIGSLINPDANMRFDFTGQGLPLRGGWITREAAWLVWDPRKTGARS